jgi:cellobiose epimerase
MRRWLIFIGFGFFLSSLPVSALASAADMPPTAEELRQQAKRCRDVLAKNIADFYLPACVDSVNGGYFETLRDGKFVATGEKFLTMQGRQLWFFCMLAREGYKKDAALAAARSGFEFLRGHMLDQKHGGYYSKVDDTGKPVDPRKHVYLNAFAMYGLVNYYHATRDEQALKAAQDLFGVLEAKAYDKANGGYVEFFYEDWRPITDPREPMYVGAIGTKTYNTHLHMLEALTDLYRVWPDPLVKQRLNELVVINTQTVHHPDFNCNIDGWTADWVMINSPANLKASFGHDVECAWLMLDAGRALGMSPHVFRSWAEALCTYSLKHGYDHRHGGFFYTGPLGQSATETKKEWWVEAEALVSMLEMYRLTHNPAYYKVFRETLDFVEKHQVASAGSWYASRQADGSPLVNTRSSPWQGAYHNGRSMLLCARLLEELAAAK